MMYYNFNSGPASSYSKGLCEKACPSQCSDKDQTCCDAASNACTWADNQCKASPEFGTWGSTSCSNGYLPITNKDICENTGMRYELQFAETDNLADLLEGCYQVDDYLYFNKHSTGSFNEDAQSRCLPEILLRE